MSFMPPISENAETCTPPSSTQRIHRDSLDLSESMGEISLRASVGPCRAHQEDASSAEVIRGAEGESLAVLVVCDGMGGAAGGEVASQAAVSATLAHLRHARPHFSVHEVAVALVQAIRVANTLVFERARRERGLRGMGCTATVAALVGRTLLVAQIGDSRAYVMRDGSLVQITRDQTLAQQLLESGQLRPEDLPTFEFSNVILQALGTSDEVMVDVSYVDLAAGDVVLLCSDGLHGQVSAAAISSALEARPAEAAARLVDLANAAGGVDNVTCIVARFALDSTSRPVDPPAYRRFVGWVDEGATSDESKDSPSTGTGSAASIVATADDTSELARAEQDGSTVRSSWRTSIGLPPIWMPLVIGAVVVALLAWSAPWW